MMFTGNKKPALARHLVYARPTGTNIGMRHMKRLMFIVGILAALLGLLWIGQGTGLFPYPANSFMISDMHWTYYGAAVAIIGIGLIAYSRRT